MMSTCCEFNPVHDAAPARVASASRPVPARSAKRIRSRAPLHLLAGLVRLRAFMLGALIGVGFWLPLFLTM